jgi:3-oxoacyl-[acyl-carrier protein] reductase
MELTDRVAIVTGSGRGIGKGIAIRLAEAGADIVVNDVEAAAEAMEGTVGEIKKMNRRAIGIAADVSLAGDVGRLVETALGTLGRIDILVNNAGVTRDGLVMRMSDDDWDTVVNIDLKSVFLCTRSVLRPMLKARWGRIISIASIVGINGNAGQANYAAAKAGVIAFTRSVAREVASRGITANAVAPGYIDTQMTQELDDKQAEELKKRIPLGYAGTPRDVAEAVAFLASEEARYITGQVLGVDGGM